MLRTLAMLGIVTALLAVVSAPASAQIAFSENFESYSDGDAFTDGANPNGWTNYAGTVTTRGFGGPYNDGSPSIATVTDIGGDLRGACCGTTAAIASIPRIGGVQQLQFDFTTDGGFPGGRLSHGLQLIDTVSGGIAKVYSDYAGWFVEYTDSVGDHTNQYIGDFGQYEDPIPQTITLTLDYDNDMMNLFTSSTDGVSTPYIGDTEATATTDHAITDAGFVPNQILYHNRWSGVSQIDDITYTPEPASLALLSIGGAALLRRRRA